MQEAAIKRFDCIKGKTAVAGLALSPDGEHLAVCLDGAAVVVVISSCEVLHRLNKYSIEAIAYSPDGKRLVAASRDGNVRIFDVASGAALADMPTGRGGYHTIAWSPDGRVVAAGHYEPQVGLFDAASGEELRLLDPEVFDDEGRTSVFFSRAGDVLASTGYNGVFLWSLQDALAEEKRVTRRRIGLRSYTHFLDASFSPDNGRLAALAETEGTSVLHFWNIKSGKKLGRIKLPNFSSRLAWSPDNRFVAVAETDGEGVSLWSPETFKPVEITLPDAASYDVNALAIDQAGKMIIAGTAAGGVIGWDLAG